MGQSVDFKRDAFLNFPFLPLVVNQENKRSIIHRRYLSELNRKKGRYPKNNIFKRLTKLGQIFIWYKNQTHRHVRRRTYVSENADSVSGGLKIVTQPAKGSDWNWILYGYCATFGKTDVIVPKLSQYLLTSRRYHITSPPSGGTTKLHSRHLSMLTCDQRSLRSRITGIASRWKVVASSHWSLELNSHALSV